MATVHRFEELTCWKKARELNRRVYSICREGALARDFGLCDQMRRASISVMSNIAEGFERGGRKEFIQFLAIAKGSAGELRAQFFALLDVGYVSETIHRELDQLAGEVGRVIAGLMRYLQGSEVAGPKYLVPELETRNSETRN